MILPDIGPLLDTDGDGLSCAFCLNVEGRKAYIANQHEGVGSLICESCVNALDAFFGFATTDATRGES